MKTHLRKQPGGRERGSRNSARFARCSWGHPIDAWATVVSRPGRADEVVCQLCHGARNAVYQARRAGRPITRLEATAEVERRRGFVRDLPFPDPVDDEFGHRTAIRSQCLWGHDRETWGRWQGAGSSDPWFVCELCRRALVRIRAARRRGQVLTRTDATAQAERAAGFERIEPFPEERSTLAVTT